MLLFRVHQASDRDSHVPDTQLSRSAHGDAAPHTRRGRTEDGCHAAAGRPKAPHEAAGRRNRPTEQNAALPRGSKAAAAAATPGPARAETRSGPHSLT